MKMTVLIVSVLSFQKVTRGSIFPAIALAHYTGLVALASLLCFRRCTTEVGSANVASTLSSPSYPINANPAMPKNVW